MKRFIRLSAIFLVVIAASYLLIPKLNLQHYHGYSRAFYDRNDQLLRLTLAGDERYRIYATLDQVSPELKEATLLYEDRYFYQHPGVDPLALIRAFWSSYVTRERTIGGSTISMQVARLHWNLKTRTIPGKIKQILRAIQLARHYGKDEIFEAYLNLAPYGRNIEGVEAASLVYFNKHAGQLSLPEALTLSVIPQNPSKRNPTTVRGFEKLKTARDRLFARWVAHHPEDAGQQVFFEMPLAVRAPEQLPFASPHFVNELDRELPMFQTGPIRTTLDIDLQRRVEQRLARYVERRKDDGITNGAVAILNHETMELEALVGSVSFWNDEIDGQVNGTKAKRSPGSTLKPFVYALAMDQAIIHPMTMLKDAPKRYGGYTPENSDQRFLGPVFARDALIASRNVPAVFLQSRISHPGLYQFLEAAGVKGLEHEDYYGLALTLGGAELTMEELLQLYAILPNGGLLRPIRKLLRGPEQGEPVSLLSPEASYLTLDILRDNPPPTQPSLTGQVADEIEVAWKTGTSFGFRDAWAIGISGPYVIAVWTGNFPGEGNPVFVGRYASGPLLFEIFRDLGRGRHWTGTGNLGPGLLNLRRVSVCADTGDLPGRYCPRETESWFIPGVSPIKVSTIHRAIPIYPQTGLRACWDRSGQTVMQVFEFWPSDLQAIFRQAGISIKTPPEYATDCSLDDKSASGMAPVIRSPNEGISYSLRSERLADEKIPFSAATDADVKELFWFVDRRYVGRVSDDAVFFWKPEIGKFTVRVVDDHGRAAKRSIHVGLVRERPEIAH